MELLHGSLVKILVYWIHFLNDWTLFHGYLVIVSGCLYQFLVASTWLNDW